jgi:ferric-dicitrate binding protein FerR (iron transport regulator)
MRAMRDDFRNEMELLRKDVRGEIADIRTEIGGIRSDNAAIWKEIAGIWKETARRSDIADLRAEMQEMSRRWDRHFIWLAGTQIATLLAVVAVLAGALYR